MEKHEKENLKRLFILKDLKSIVILFSIIKKNIQIQPKKRKKIHLELKNIISFFPRKKIGRNTFSKLSIKNQKLKKSSRNIGPL